MARRFTDEQELEIVKKWKDWGIEAGVKNFAKTTGASCQTISNLLQKHNARLQQQKKFSEAERAEFIKLWKEAQLSMTAFSAKFQINHITMKKILDESGIPNGVQLKKIPVSPEKLKVNPILGKDIYLNDIPKDGFCKFPKIISTENGINTHEWCGERSGDSSWCPDHHVVCVSKTYSNPNPRCMGYKNFL